MTNSLISSVDEARAAHPEFGFALYAYEPGRPVTLEIIAPDGSIARFDGQTEAAVLREAFPPEEPAPAEDPAPITATDLFG